MPYAPGYTFLDGAGQRILDGAANVVQEAEENLAGLLQLVQTIYDDVVDFSPYVKALGDDLSASGVFPQFSLGWSLAYLIDQAINGPMPLVGDDNIFTNETYGLAALQAQLAAIYGETRFIDDGTTNSLATILAALGAPVTLPDPPPSGYGGGDAPTVEQIWGHYLNGVSGDSVTADEALSVTRNYVNFYFYYAGVPVRNVKGFLVDAVAASGGTWPTGFNGVTCDFTDIHADDTVLSWLTRTDTSGREWEVDPVTGLVFSPTNLPDEYHSAIFCTLTDPELLELGGFGTPGELADTNTPPIWPGLANVTLGDSVPLTANLTITGPLDGVLVNVTTPPGRLSEIVVGGVSYWYRVGEITFISDNGEAEPFQYLGFQNAIYTPRFMKQAASAKLRVLGGAAGTATPWLVTV